MPARDCCLVTCYYTEKSTSDHILVHLSTTLGDLRNQIHAKIKATLQSNWGEGNAIHPDPASITIAASTCGSKPLINDDLVINQFCTEEDQIFAIVPSASTLPAMISALGPEYLSEPLRTKVKNSKQLLVDSINTLQNERDKRAAEKSGYDTQMEEMMAKVQGMIEGERVRVDKRLTEGLADERVRADKKLAGELARADQRLANELEKAGKRLTDGLADAAKRMDEMERQKNGEIEALKQKLNEVDAITMDTAEWISTGDTALLDRIKLRNLLNIAQEKLARAAKLTNTPIGASLVWRDRLGCKQDFAARLATAHELLNQEYDQLDERTRQFCDSSEGMRLACEKASEIRERGDDVAHQKPPSRQIYAGAINRFNSQGMRAIGDFVCV